MVDAGGVHGNPLLCVSSVLLLDVTPPLGERSFGRGELEADLCMFL